MLNWILLLEASILGIVSEEQRGGKIKREETLILCHIHAIFGGGKLERIWRSS